MSSSDARAPFNSQTGASGEFDDSGFDSDKYTPGTRPKAPRMTRSVSNTQKVDFTPSTTKHIRFETPTPARVSPPDSIIQTTDNGTVAITEQDKKKKKKKRSAYAKFMHDVFRTKRSHKDKRQELEREIMKGKLVVSKQRDRL